MFIFFIHFKALEILKQKESEDPYLSSIELMIFGQNKKFNLTQLINEYVEYTNQHDKKKLIAKYVELNNDFLVAENKNIGSKEVTGIGIASLIHHVAIQRTEQNIANAQNALINRAKLNSLATTGEYSEDME